MQSRPWVSDSLVQNHVTLFYLLSIVCVCTNVLLKVSSFGGKDRLDPGIPSDYLI